MTTRILLDTHVFLWWDSEPEKLTVRVKGLLEDSATEILLSVASVWEMQIKQQLGKLRLDVALSDLVDAQQTQNGIGILDVELSHVYRLDSLPMQHRDPFDRLLIAQALCEGIPLVSHDPQIRNYPVPIIW